MVDSCEICNTLNAVLLHFDWFVFSRIESIKTASMEDVSTRVLEKIKNI